MAQIVPFSLVGALGGGWKKDQVLQFWQKKYQFLPKDPIKFANIVDDVVAMLLGRKKRFKAFIRSEHKSL